MKKSKRLSRLLCLLFATILCLGAFSSCKISFGSQKTEKVGLYIVCTIFPQYDFVRSIVGDLATPEMLLPAGSETHTFGLKDISTQKLDELYDADLFIYVGGESDEDFIEEMKRTLSEKTLFVALTDLIASPLSELQTGGMAVDGEADDEEEGESFDEHVWTSPKRAIEIVEKLTEILCRMDEENASAFSENSRNYIKDLQDLDAKFEAIKEAKTVDTLIFADRFPFRYLCYDYGIEADAAFQGCSSSIEPSLTTMNYLIGKAKELSLPAILYMEGSKTSYAEDMARQIGGQALMLHSCHIVSSKEYAEESYISLQEKNLETLRIALGVGT